MNQMKEITKLTKQIGTLLACLLSLIAGNAVVYAAKTPTLYQTISEGTLDVDIVDSGGTTVASPSVTFSAASFSFSTQDTTGTLPAGTDKIRVYNPTATATWTVNLRGANATDLWTSGGNTYDFNDTNGYTDGADADSKGGQMTVNPNAGTLAGVSGCATTNVSKGTQDSFVEGSVDNIDLVSAAAGASTFCRWDLTGVSMTQKVPAAQPAGSYNLNMQLTVI